MEKNYRDVEALREQQIDDRDERIPDPPPLPTDPHGGPPLHDPEKCQTLSEQLEAMRKRLRGTWLTQKSDLLHELHLIADTVSELGNEVIEIGHEITDLHLKMARLSDRLDPPSPSWPRS